MMEKEEQAIHYFYKVIKNDNPTNAVVGEWICTSDDKLSDEFYKPVGTFRRAFIGDMQKKFDIAYSINNMENFARTVKQGRETFIYEQIIKYRKPVSLYRRIKRRILIYFRERSERRYFKEVFYTKRNEF
jgi:hypothetical protein